MQKKRAGDPEFSGNGAMPVPLPPFAACRRPAEAPEPASGSGRPRTPDALMPCQSGVKDITSALRAVGFAPGRFGMVRSRTPEK